MRVLIDNATLTAALRASGMIPSTPDEVQLLDLDIAALRLLLEQIIFAEHITVLNTYKPEHTRERLEFLDHESVKFHTIHNSLDRRMAKHAAAHVVNWGLTKDAGNEYKGLFESLSVLFLHVWRNSESFLVFRALGEPDKYNSPIIEGFRRDLQYGDGGSTVKSMPHGKTYDDKSARVLQSLVWAAVRTVYYRQCAKLVGAEYVPHPLRNMFNLKCILFDNHPNTRNSKLSSEELMKIWPDEIWKKIGKPQAHNGVIEYTALVENFLKNFWDDCVEADENVFGVATYDVTVPPILAMVLAQLDTKAHPRDIFEAAFELRNRADCCAVRAKLVELYKAEETIRPKLLRELADDFRTLKSQMQAYLGYSREHVSLSAKVISYRFTVPRFALKPYYPFSPHLAFVRDVILDLAATGAMGRLHDLLWTIRRNAARTAKRVEEVDLLMATSHETRPAPARVPVPSEVVKDDQQAAAEAHEEAENVRLVLPESSG